MKKDNNSLYEAFHASTSSQDHFIQKNNFTYRIILQHLEKYLKAGTTLDIGCGAGTIDFYLAGNKNIPVHGIDISDKAIRSAKITAKKLNLTTTSFETMTFPIKVPRGKFDNVICMEVIEHLENDSKALKEIFKLLNKNGIAVISTPSKNAPVYRLGLADKFDKRVGHLRRYDLDELISLAELSGFKVVSTSKTEGLIRNFLFINPIAGKFLRFIKGPFIYAINWLDEISLKLFGESDLFIILKKP